MLAGLTTVAGYGSNVASSIVRIREFGLLSGFGVGASLIIALAFVPAVLSVFRPERYRVGARADDCPGGGCPPGETACASDVSFRPGALGDHRRGVQKERLEAGKMSSPSWRASLFEGIGGFVARRGRAIGILAVAVAVLAVAGIARVTVDTNPVTFFPSGSIRRRDFDLVRSNFGGVDTIQIMVDGDILDPEHSAIERIHDEFESAGGYGQALSIVNVLKQASRALHDNDPAWERLPSTRDEAAQYVLLVSMSGDAGLDEMITIDNNHARIQVMADTMAGSKSKEGTLKSAVRSSRRIWRASLTVSSFSITGMPFLEKSMAEMVISSRERACFLPR